MKEQVVQFLRSQGYEADDLEQTYVTWASETDTSTVVVAGTFYGPSKEKGVLATYKEIHLTQNADGTWKVTEAVAGIAAPEASAEAAGEGAKGGEAVGEPRPPRAAKRARARKQHRNSDAPRPAGRGGDR